MEEINIEKFQLATEYINNDLKSLRSDLDVIYSIHESYEKTRKRLSDLSDKTKHAAMIPVGTKAFAPGFITNTNELSVHLGAEVYADVTVKQAMGIVDRRMTHLQELVYKKQDQMKDISVQWINLNNLLHGGEIGVSSREDESSHKKPLKSVVTGSISDADALPSTMVQMQTSMANAKTENDRLFEHMTNAVIQSSSNLTKNTDVRGFDSLQGMPIPNSYSLNVQGTNDQGLEVFEICEEFNEDVDLFGYDNSPISQEEMDIVRREERMKEMKEVFDAGFDAQYHAQYSQFSGQHDADGEWLDSLYPDSEDEVEEGTKVTVIEEDDEDEEDEDLIDEERLNNATKVEKPFIDADQAGVVVSDSTPTVDYDGLWKKLDILNQPEPQLNDGSDNPTSTSKSANSHTKSDDDTINYNLGMGLSAAMATALAQLDEYEEEDEDWDDGGFYSQYMQWLDYEGDEGEQYEEEDEVDGLVVGGGVNPGEYSVDYDSLMTFNRPQSKIEVIDDDESLGEMDLSNFRNVGPSEVVTGETHTVRATGGLPPKSVTFQEDEYLYGHSDKKLLRSSLSNTSNVKVFGVDDEISIPTSHSTPSSSILKQTTPPSVDNSIELPSLPEPNVEEAPAFTGVVSVKEKPKKKKTTQTSTDDSSSPTDPTPTAAVSDVVVAKTRPKKTKTSLQNSISNNLNNSAMYQTVTIGGTKGIDTITTTGIPTMNSDGSIQPDNAPQMSRFKLKQLGLLDDEEV